jgi:hypothetical protein
VRREQTLFPPLTAGRVLFYLLVAPAMLLALLYGWRAMQVHQRGYSWADMDWDGNGRTSIGEYFATTGVGTRLTTLGGRTCVSYFWISTQRPIRVTCPAE